MNYDDWLLQNSVTQLQQTPVAIIGMACIFPQASSLQAYWENIIGKVDCITEVPPSRFRLFPQVYDRLETLAADVGRVMHEQTIYPRSLTRLSQAAQAAKQAEFFSDGVAMCQTSIGFTTAYTLMLREVFQVQPQVAFGYSLGEASGMLFALSVWNDKHHYYAPTAMDALALSPLFKTQLCGPCLAGRQFWGLPEIAKSPGAGANGRFFGPSADRTAGNIS
ncbi:MAG: hypothetical protein GDA38_26905 [Hormoscilla sp. SP12CHS1]|nr:hypothetical protein [Hormoscilla sp. SP12CHS1]